MRLAIIIGLLALASCVQRDNTVQCDHVNDKARWAQYPQYTAAQYDSLAVANEWRCTSP